MKNGSFLVHFEHLKNEEGKLQSLSPLVFFVLYLELSLRENEKNLLTHCFILTFSGCRSVNLGVEIYL